MKQLRKVARHSLPLRRLLNGKEGFFLPFCRVTGVHLDFMALIVLYLVFCCSQLICFFAT